MFFCFIETHNVRNGERYRLCFSRSINHGNMYWILKGTTPLMQTFISFHSKENVVRKCDIKNRNNSREAIFLR